MGREILKCPKCNNKLEVDSVRNFCNGKKRVYWECEKCKLSIMERETRD